MDRKNQIKVLSILHKLSIWDVDALDIKHMQGNKNYLRVRFGKYRLIFEKQDKTLIITVIDIGPRGDIYK